MIRTAARAARALACCAALAAGGRDGLAAQEGCSFVEGSGNLATMDQGGSPVTYVGTPNLVCRDGVRIRADSAVAYQAASYVQLIGRVRFEDAERRLSAARAEYFTTVGRLQAHADVRVEQKTDGGLIRGEEMIYLRAGDERARDQLDVFGEGRSTARLYARARADSTREAGPAATPDSSSAPYDVEADRILIEGDSYFRAMGAVEIARDRMEAFGDTTEYDQLAGTLRIVGQARLILDDRELTAEVIQARLPGDVVSEVIATRQAVLTADQVRLEAPLVHVFFADGVMERLVAVPIAAATVRLEPGELPPPRDAADTTRPVARAERFAIVADSLEVVTPAEALERIHAAGDARAESSARDSLNTPDTPALARTDWMEGDTIVATFVPADSAAAPPSDDEDDYRLERLTAIGSARSLYRMIPDDSARACGGGAPVIHYVTARRIVIEMTDGEIDRMDVTGQTEGVHAEPACQPRDSAAADSLPTPPAAAPPAVDAPGLGALDGGRSGGVALVASPPRATRRARRRR